MGEVWKAWFSINGEPQDVEMEQEEDVDLRSWTLRVRKDKNYEFRTAGISSTCLLLSLRFRAEKIGANTEVIWEDKEILKQGREL